MEKVIVYIVNQMEKENIIKQSEVDEYIYAYICIFEKIIGVFSIIVLSTIMHNLFNSLTFLLTFGMLRKRTGGYHFDSFISCYIFSIIIYICSCFLSETLYKHNLILFVFYTIAFITIMSLKTINHPNMDLDDEEVLENTLLSHKLIIVITCIDLAFYNIYKLKKLAIYSMVGVILCAVLICISKISKQEVSK